MKKLSPLFFLIANFLPGAATTPSPGLKYYYPAPDAPVVYENVDIVVYGGTSGGVTAAVQARRMGKSVALVVFGRQVGGLTASGLTQTDGVDASVQGGICREFFDVVGNSGFRPKTAREEFERMLLDPIPSVEWDEPIPTYYEQRPSSVEMEGTKITAVHMENGSVFRGKVFIDCSYEGDLMALAGVSYTVGRESQLQYAESRAGKKEPKRITPNVDPYIVPGDASSGLIWGVNEDAEGPLGSGDSFVQGYNFRMYLGGSGQIWEPEAYDPAMFEMLYRWIRGGAIASVPNGNDINNHEFNSGVISSDVVGQNWDWADASYAHREEIFQTHVAWHMGMFWYYRNDPRFAAMATDPELSSTIQNRVQNLISKANQVRLPLDQYPDTDGWPHELYIREARRMVSDHIATEAHYSRAVLIEDAVALPNYTADSHDVRRIVTGDEASPGIANAGNTGGGPTTPWRLSYRAMVPKNNECSNLYVTWAISASHVAFASFRMEPTHMVLSQSAATAAAMVIDDNLAVQDLPYPKLKMQLLADGQILGENPVISTDAIFIDNGSPDCLLEGNWLLSKASPGYYSLNYVHDNNAPQEPKIATFFTKVPSSGEYQVSLRWTSNGNRASNVPVEIIHAEGTFETTIDMRERGGEWIDLGTFQLNGAPDECLRLSNTDTDGYVIADAVRITPLIPPPTFAEGINIIATRSASSEMHSTPAMVTVARNDESTEEIEVFLDANGENLPNEILELIPPSVVIPSGQSSVSFDIPSTPDDIAQGDKEINISIAANANYSIGEFSGTRVVIRDRPYDNWRFSYFAQDGNENDPISLPDADFDQDGIPNILEYMFQTNPTQYSVHPKLVFVSDNGSKFPIFSFQKSSRSDDLNIEILAGNRLDNLQVTQGDFVYSKWNTELDAPVFQFSPDSDPNFGDTVFYRLKVSLTP